MAKVIDKTNPDSRAVYVDLIRSLFHTSYLALTTTFISSLVILYFLYNVVSNQILYIWFAAQFLASGIRIFFAYKVLNNRWSNRFEHIVKYELVFIIGSFFSGAIWGSIGFFPLEDTDQVHYFSFMAFIIGGLSAGASISMAASRKAFIAFLIPILIPVTIKMSLFEDQVSTGMVLFMVLYFIALLFINRTNFLHFKTATFMKFQNVGLIESMEKNNLKLNNMYNTEKKLRSKMAEEIETRKMVEKELRELSTIDSLTGLYNRRFFDSFAVNLMSQCERFDEIFSIILIDIDNFKVINDSFGHQEGDFVLIEISKLFRSNTRKSDLVARIGGEEFVILCPHHDLKTTNILAEKIRLVVEKSKVSKQTKVTISAGICSYKPNITLDTLINECDKALYKAKTTGKNKVVL